MVISVDNRNKKIPRIKVLIKINFYSFFSDEIAGIKMTDTQHCHCKENGAR